MAREAKSKTINNTSYTVTQLGPSRGLDLLHDLVKVLGPAFAPILSNARSLSSLLDTEIGESNLDFIGQAVRELASSADKAVTRRVLQELASVTIIDGKGKLSNVYEAHFADVGIGELFQWAAFALQTQYEDFFSVFGNAIKSASLPAPKTFPK